MELPRLAFDLAKAVVAAGMALGSVEKSESAVQMLVADQAAEVGSHHR